MCVFESYCLQEDKKKNLAIPIRRQRALSSLRLSFWVLVNRAKDNMQRGRGGIDKYLKYDFFSRIQPSILGWNVFALEPAQG